MPVIRSQYHQRRRRDRLIFLENLPFLTLACMGLGAYNAAISIPIK
jgi:hypothetical protein